MSRVFGVGVIGVGAMGDWHLRAFTSLRNVKVAAIADINKEALRTASEKHKVDKTFTDYHDLLALDMVRGVAVCTPPFNHAVITCDAAKAGKHVLCEKPMALNAMEAKEMVETCNKAQVKLGLGSARSRFSPSVELAKEYVGKGKLGKIYYARATTVRRRGRPGIDILKESKWFINSAKSGGGSLIDIGCYDIDVLLYLLGDVQPQAVSASTFTGVGEPLKLDTAYDVEEHSSVFVRFKEDVAATFETTWAANLNSYNETVVFGSIGSLKLNPFTYYTEEEGKGIAKTIDVGDSRASNMLAEDFIAACLENKQPKTPGEDGLKVMQVIDMAYRSARLKREATLRDLEKSR